MPANLSVRNTQVLGTSGSAATLGAGLASSSLNPNGVFLLNIGSTRTLEANLILRVTIGTAPTVAPTAQLQQSPDNGTTWFNLGGAYVVPLTASTNNDYDSGPLPISATEVRWLVTNGDSTVAVSVLSWGNATDSTA